jgi:hypothetical protein
MMDNFLDASSDKFGKEQTDDYVILQRAMLSYVRFGEAYYRIPAGHPTEQVVLHLFNDMTRRIANDPEKAVEMLQALVALLTHMKTADPEAFTEWFARVGLDAAGDGLFGAAKGMSQDDANMLDVMYKLDDVEREMNKRADG